MAISCESFLKEKYPEILKEFKKEQAIKQKAEKERTEKERERRRKNCHFWEFDFSYKVEISYKGFTDSVRESSFDFNEAFNIITENNIGEKWDIVTDCPDNLPVDPGLSFNEWIEELAIDESEIKDIIKDMLYDTGSTAINDRAESIWDWDARLVDDVSWDGKYVFPKKYFNIVWEDFKKCRFMNENNKHRNIIDELTNPCNRE